MERTGNFPADARPAGGPAAPGVIVRDGVATREGALIELRDTDEEERRRLAEPPAARPVCVRGLEILEGRDTDGHDAALAGMAVDQGFILLGAMGTQAVKWEQVGRLAVSLLTNGLGSEAPRSP